MKTLKKRILALGLAMLAGGATMGAKAQNERCPGIIASGYCGGIDLNLNN